jgi:hypothetical protein
MNSAPYYFMVVKEKNADFSIFGHGMSFAYELFPCPGCPV